jgi:hypothetical protein
VLVPGTADVNWDVETVSFRKICEYKTSVTGSDTLRWDLKDKYGSQVANGLYYIRVQVAGAQPLARILKVMVLR